jgi:hypothetical protein
VLQKVMQTQVPVQVMQVMQVMQVRQVHPLISYAIHDSVFS